MKIRYKKTKIGEIPEDWGLIKLSEGSERITDGSHFSPVPQKDSDFYIATVKDMGNHSFNLNTCAKITKEEFLQLVRNGCRPEKGDILFSKDGTIGKTFVFEGSKPIVLLSSIAIIRLNKSVLDSNFTCQVLKSFIFEKQLEGLRSGSAIRRLVLKSIKEIRVPLPTITEQQKIAAIFSRVDEKIEVISNRISEILTLKKGLMQRLFTKGIGHSQFKDSALGVVPESWEVLQLGSLTSKVGSGTTPRGGREAYVESGIPFIRSQNVLYNKLDLSKVAYITEEQHEKMSGSQLMGDDVLLNITGASIGRSCVLPSEFRIGNVNQHVCIIRSNGNIIPHYLGKFLNSSLGQNQINRFQAGGNREGLNFQQIRSFKIPLPSIEEQRKIAAILSSVDDKLQILQEKKETYQELKRGLMQVLLTGKIRVSP